MSFSSIRTVPTTASALTTNGVVGIRQPAREFFERSSRAARSAGATRREGAELDLPPGRLHAAAAQRPQLDLRLPGAKQALARAAVGAVGELEVEGAVRTGREPPSGREHRVHGVGTVVV